MTKGNTELIDAGVAGHSRAFLVKGRKTVIVDTGLPGNTQNILKALELNGIQASDVSLIVITHGHNDHFGSARELKEMLRVPVAMGRADAKYLAEGKNAPIVPTPEGLAMLRMIQSRNQGKDYTNIEPALLFQPDILVDGDMDLSEYGVDAEVLHTPGHTSGSLSVAARGGDCAIGDLLAAMPPSNVPGFPLLAEDPKAIGPSLKKVLEHNPAGLCPAHGSRIEAAEARKKFAGIIQMGAVQ